MTKWNDDARGYGLDIGHKRDGVLYERDGQLRIDNEYGLNMVVLTSETVRDLLPLLQHFAETGTLPEPKS